MVSAQNQNNSPVILIIDDNPDDRESYIRRLKMEDKTDYMCLEAEQAIRAMEIVQSVELDCVLLDYSLPGLNGLEVLKQIRASHAYLPVVLLTGQGDESTAVKAIQMGAENYLVKSKMGAEPLDRIIKEAIIHSQWKREIDEKNEQISSQNTTLSEMVVKLKKVNSELESFSYVASHDMQEPLRTISSFCGLIVDEYRDKFDAQGLEYLGLIEEAALRIQIMVKDLLDYASLGEKVDIFVKFDAAAEYQHALDNLADTINNTQAKIECDPLPQLKGNPIHFGRLLQNLIGNALKYQTPSNIPQIHIGIADIGSFWEICVQDNGIGIVEAHLERVFQPFKRLQTWHEYQGTGLGLSLCRNIVEKQGGTIHATSSIGKGTALTFTWPKTGQEAA